MKKTIQTSFLLVIALTIAIVLPAKAQEAPGLTLSLSRDFGYGGFGGDIQGVFSVHAKGPDDLVKVVFYIDENILAEVTTPPFRYQFNTGDYGLGKHTLSAVGTTAGGAELPSNVLVREFVSASQGGKAALNIVLPLLGVILAAGLLAWGIPALFMRGRLTHLPAGAPRSYGALGGAICPKCGRPFAIHMFGLNIVVGKYDRCPYCGKWSVVRRTSLDVLKAAEAAEIAAEEAFVEPVADSDEDKLRKELENSRYQDL